MGSIIGVKQKPDHLSGPFHPNTQNMKDMASNQGKQNLPGIDGIQAYTISICLLYK